MANLSAIGALILHPSQRIQLRLPEQVDFETAITIEVGHLNYGNHLANDAVLRIAHEVRLRFLAEHGCTETDVFGIGLIMTDAVVQYRAQAFHGDTLRVQVALSGIGKTGFAFYVKLIRESDQVEIARLKCGMAFYDYAAQRVGRTPVQFIRHFQPDGAA